MPHCCRTVTFKKKLCCSNSLSLSSDLEIAICGDDGLHVLVSGDKDFSALSLKLPLPFSNSGLRSVPQRSRKTVFGGRFPLLNDGVFSTQRK